MSFFQEYLDDLVMEKVADYLTEMDASKQVATENRIRQARIELAKNKKFINASPAKKKKMLEEMYNKASAPFSQAQADYALARAQKGADMELHPGTDPSYKLRDIVSHDEATGTTTWKDRVNKGAVSGAQSAYDKRLAAMGTEHEGHRGLRTGKASLKDLLHEERSMGGKAMDAVSGAHNYIQGLGKYAPHAVYGAAGLGAAAGAYHLATRKKRRD